MTNVWISAAGLCGATISWIRDKGVAAQMERHGAWLLRRSDARRLNVRTDCPCL